jgi:hypothetical protein
MVTKYILKYLSYFNHFIKKRQTFKDIINCALTIFRGESGAGCTVSPQIVIFQPTLLKRLCAAHFQPDLSSPTIAPMAARTPYVIVIVKPGNRCKLKSSPCA